MNSFDLVLLFPCTGAKLCALLCAAPISAIEWGELARVTNDMNRRTWLSQTLDLQLQWEKCWGQCTVPLAKRFLVCESLAEKRLVFNWVKWRKGRRLPRWRTWRCASRPHLPQPLCWHTGKRFPEELGRSCTKCCLFSFPRGEPACMQGLSLFSSLSGNLCYLLSVI